MTNLPFILLLLLWLIVSCLSLALLVVIARLPKFGEFKRLEGRCAELMQRFQNLEPDVEESTRIAAQLKQNRAEETILRSQVEKLELEKQQLEPLALQVAELEGSLSKKHNDLNAAVAEERGLREEIIRLECAKKLEEEDVENRQRTMEKIDDQVGILREEESSIQTKISQEKEKMEKLERLRKATVDALSLAEEKLKGLRETYVEEKEDVARGIKKLKQDYADQNKELQMAYCAEKKELDEKLQVLGQQYLVERGNLEKITRECSRLRGEAEALEKEIVAWTEQIKALKADHRKSGGADKSEDKLKDLWHGVFTTDVKISQKAESEDTRLKDLAKTLEERQIVFPSRTLYAFHTALKTAELSPLTVLAGISGTGKSLLPGVYSEAMGIHFLNLAVQPRWDSPQDMFGFYNYMEQKYSATELARAMVQFDRHNLRGNIGDLKDQMLMVLLDEMNLARVEYYFSEFLSKLETRRDSKMRSKSEIVLETGHGNGDGEVRLYPDRNILFVGTMNEDESTQNLSDKVLDRACVLRFGKPNVLKLVQPERNSAQVSNSMLPQAEWMKWVKSSTQSSSIVEEFVSKLNKDVMAPIGKPFAHRVGKAINSYVLNYPEWVRDSENIALADQVEQRILPKLRGLNVDDHHDAFNKLSSIIRDLGDDVLLKAFEAGRNSGNSRGMNSFIWRGVDRSEKQ